MTKRTKKITTKALFILISITAIIFTAKLFIFSEEFKNEDISNEFSKRYAVYSLEIPEHIDFAGENIPTNLFDVKESLDNELTVNTYWQSRTIMILKRTQRFFKIIEPILKKNNIPNDFKYLAVIESGLENVVSPSGAKGYWQFLEATAKEYDLEVNNYVDERYDIEKSTQAACEYLNDSYKIFKNWTIVAASYNMGKNGISRQLEKQNVNSYYDLLLNKETGRYVYRIVALKLIFSNPEKFGFHVPIKHRYNTLKFDTISTDTTITNIADYAILNSTNYKIFKLYNPWLRKSSLKVENNNSYTFRIPKKGFRENNISEPKVD